MGNFINPFTDFGFKKLFGTEGNKECLLHFINQLLEQEGEDKITSITYNNKEQLGRKISDRYAIFDIYCITEKGEHIIIELQNAKQKMSLTAVSTTRHPRFSLKVLREVGTTVSTKYIRYQFSILRLTIRNCRKMSTCTRLNFTSERTKCCFTTN